MILEVATLDVIAGRETAFEAAFAQARPLIASIAGYRTHTLQRCLEQRSRYVLLVEWDTLEAHTVGFRGSPQYQQWRALLHHFYEPFPTVLHYEAVTVAPAGAASAAAIPAAAASAAAASAAAAST